MYAVVLSADWRYRHAALMAISACGEGCHQQMENVLTGIVEAIIPFLQDSVSVITFCPFIYISS